jgi:hypothetical protein
MEETQTDRSGQKSFASCSILSQQVMGGELVLPESSLVFASRGLNYWPLVKMEQRVTKSDWLPDGANASGIPLKQEKVQYNLAIFFLLVLFERTMQPCRRNAEQKDEIPSKVPLLRHATRGQHVSQIGLHPPHHKNTLQSTSVQRFERNALAFAKVRSS